MIKTRMASRNSSPYIVGSFLCSDPTKSHCILVYRLIDEMTVLIAQVSISGNGRRKLFCTSLHLGPTKVIVI